MIGGSRIAKGSCSSENFEGGSDSERLAKCLDGRLGLACSNVDFISL